MNKSVLSVLLTLVIIPVHSHAQAPADTVKPAPKHAEKKAVSPLEGAWLMTEAWDGEDKEEDLGFWFEFKGNNLIANIEGEQEIAIFKIDTKKKQLVITAKDERIHVLYKIEKDLLTLCYHLESMELPKDFEIGEDKALFRFKLMKPLAEKFQGIWSCQEIWEDGEKSDDGEVQEYSFKIGAHSFEIHDTDELKEANGEEVEPDEAFLAIMDEKTNRLLLDDQMGETFNCIYKVENDILTIHFYDNTDAEGKNADYPKDYKITNHSVLMKLKKSPENVK